MRRKSIEPHLEDGGIYRMRWWAYYDDIVNRISGKDGPMCVVYFGDRQVPNLPVGDLLGWMGVLFLLPIQKPVSHGPDDDLLLRSDPKVVLMR